VKGRVSGSLAVTRALGDLELKSQGVSNIPDIEEIEITNKTNFLIVAVGRMRGPKGRRFGEDNGSGKHDGDNFSEIRQDERQQG